MKQLIQNMRNGKTQVVEVPTPHAKPGTALVQVASSLVSAGTERMLVEFSEKSLLGKARSRPDLMKQVLDKAQREGIVPTLESAFNRLDQPMSLGYSSAGTVVEVGKGLMGIKVGDRVACAGANHAVHAEYNIVPKNLLTKIPEEVDFDSAAFTTLGSIALHGFRLAKPQLEDNVCIIGLGLLGLLAGKISLAAGCRVFGVDLDPKRVALARKEGIKAVLRKDVLTAAETFTNSHGFDCVLICADSKTNDPIDLAAALARERGRVVAVGAVGLGLTRKPFYDKELFFQVSRSYGPGRYDMDYEENGKDYPYGFVRWTEGRNLAAFVDLIANGKIEVKSLITHRFPIEKAESAYSLITGKEHEPFLGVILNYPVSRQAKTKSRVEIQVAKQTHTVNEIRVGVLGAGNYANATFLPTMKKVGGALPTGIASGSGMSATHSARKFGFQFAAASTSEIINDKNINTVVILTRHNQHANQTIESLKKGKNVFCEKPLAMNEKELEAIRAEIAKKNSATLTVGFNRRFAPLSQKLYGFLENRSEPFMATYRVNAGFLPTNHWSNDPVQGGGRLLAEGCHFIDYLCFLAKELPDSVQTFQLPDNGKYNQDNLLVVLTFPDGSIGNVVYLANGDKSVSKENIEVFCEGKVAILNDYRTLTLVNNGNRKTYKQPWRQDKGHAGIWKAFLESIKGRRDLPIPLEEIFGVHQATFAAVKSLSSGKKELVLQVSHIPL
jgi:predicted dehydrogenase/threonine dehydrogenase-like Zn-dependent dehydrogenase